MNISTTAPRQAKLETADRGPTWATDMCEKTGTGTNNKGSRHRVV